MKPSFAGLGAIALAASPLAAIPIAVPFEAAQAQEAGQRAAVAFADSLHYTARNAYQAITTDR